MPLDDDVFTVLREENGPSATNIFFRSANKALNMSLSSLNIANLFALADACYSAWCQSSALRS